MAAIGQKMRLFPDLQGRSDRVHGRRNQAAAACLFAVCVVALAGCSSEPFAAADQRRLTDDEPRWRNVLSGSEQSEVSAAMGSVAAGATVVERPQRAPHGVRWSDVEAAASAAAAEVEMAIVRTVKLPDAAPGFEFILKSVDDRPASLTVRRLESDRVYEAAATVGRFGDDHVTEKKLLAAFERFMHDYGNKRRFEQG